MPDSATDIYVLLKRLEVLKTVIALQDVEDIAAQLVKFEEVIADLEGLDLVMETAWVADMLRTASYGDAMLKIDGLINRYKHNVTITNPEVEGLRTEIAVLTAQINTLEVEVSGVEKTMFEFDLQQTAEIGELALKVLTFKRKKAASKAEQLTGDRDAQRELEDAEMEEERYRGAYEQKMARLMHQVTEEQLQDLRAKFKKIAKLTHPDLVDKRFEMAAVELFRRAKEAKDINDHKTITEIYDHLVNDKPFELRVQTPTEIEVLRNETKYLRRLLDVLVQKMASLKLSDTYQTMISIDDWGQYFRDVKAKMMLDLSRLEMAAA